MTEETANTEATPSDGEEPAAIARAESLSPGLAQIGWSVLFRAAVADRYIDGELTSDTVPVDALSLPVDVAIKKLFTHFTKCRNPNCQHVPNPLHPYRHMRPEVIKQRRFPVYKVLWTHSKHELVRNVREEILEKHSQLKERLSTVSPMDLNDFQTLLRDQGPMLLASVIWADEFRMPQADTLFRCFVALVTPEKAEAPKIERQPDHIDDEKSYKSKFRNMVRERDRLALEKRTLTSQLESKQREFEKKRKELEDAQKKLGELANTSVKLESKLRDGDLRYRELLRSSEKTSSVADSLRSELRVAQKAWGELEADRAQLALQLANQRRVIENLKLSLAAIPTGPDAVDTFLREEEQRIEIARTISAGGDKLRAEEDWTHHRKVEREFFEWYPRYRQPAPVKLRTKTASRFIALGGADEVGRSCYVVELANHRIMVDCGIKPSSDNDLYPDLTQVDRLDALVLTHAHTDHIGWVPALVQRFPDLAIYCSEATAALLPVMLEDCYQHYSRKMFLRRERAKYIANADPVEEHYYIGNVHEVPSLVINCQFNQEEGLPFGGASLNFYPAGHILGAASVLLKDDSGRRIFFSGDFSSFPQLTIGAADWSDEIGDVDLLVLESTYGGREPHRPQEESRNDLVTFVKKTIEDQGSVILASFGLGRAQELLKLIATRMAEGQLPNVPVYVDGMINRINPIYRRLAHFDIPENTFHEVTGETDRQEVAAVAQTHPSIIVTTSGMMTGGPVLHYARNLLPDARHRIVLTGFQDEGAPSKVLREVTAGRRLITYKDERGDDVQFEAKMPAKHIGLSAHADQPGLLEYASKIRPRQIALVHGEPQAQLALRERLLHIHPGAAVFCGPSDFQCV
jgi:Cft2 family RNA processing exonuclease/predicted  nucleic acid-binding Zn-ribbon protein